MIAARIQSLLRRLGRFVLRALLRYQLWANDEWLRDCMRDKCLSAGHVREVERQQAVIRVRIALTLVKD